MYYYRNEHYTYRKALLMAKSLMTFLILKHVEVSSLLKNFSYIFLCTVILLKASPTSQFCEVDRKAFFVTCHVYISN